MTEHGYSHSNSERVGPTYQGAGGRTIYVVSCKCGWYSSNSANIVSAEKKLREHLKGAS